MQETITTIITSALVASIAGIAVNAWLESRKSKWMTKLDALKIAIDLEGYALECADKIGDHNTAVSSHGSAGSLMGGVPELPDYAVEVGILRPKKSSVANRLLVLPQELKQAQQQVSFWWEVVGDPDCYHQAAAEQSAKIGIKAIEIASDLRSAFKLPPRTLVFGDYDVHKMLSENIRESA